MSCWPSAATICVMFWSPPLEPESTIWTMRFTASPSLVFFMLSITSLLIFAATSFMALEMSSSSFSPSEMPETFLYRPLWTFERIVATDSRPSLIFSFTKVSVSAFAMRSDVPTLKPVYRLYCVTMAWMSLMS